MKLELLSLRAVNCGPLRDVRIDFSDGNGHARPVTLLAGANGSGKTTILELIAALAELLLNRALKLKEMVSESHPWYEAPDNILGRTEYASMTLLVNGKEFLIAFGVKPEDENFPSQYFYFQPFGDSLYQIHPYGYVWEDIQDAIRAQVKTPLDFVGGTGGYIAGNLLPSFLYIQHYRSFDQIEGQELVKADNVYQFVYRYKPSTTFRGSLESYLIWLEYSEPEIFDRVKEVVSSLFPQKKKLAIDRKRLKVVINLNDGTRHDLDLLSSGEQNLLITLIELRRRLISGSIMLFDEIENSLHPAFQHRMAQALLRLQGQVPFQLIVTSHAEAFIDVFGTAATRILPMPTDTIK